MKIEEHWPQVHLSLTSSSAKLQNSGMYLVRCEYRTGPKFFMMNPFDLMVWKGQMEEQKIPFSFS